MPPDLPRRRFMVGAIAAGTLLIGCSEQSDDTTDTESDTTDAADPTTGATTTAASATTAAAATGAWHMPAEEVEHERTWMCWPSSTEVWGEDLGAVQDTIVNLATAIADFEPVTLLCRPAELDNLRAKVGDGIDLVAAPVDDLWARDTLPNFLVGTGADGQPALAAGHVQFNGWGDKQIHDGDAQLAAIVAKHLGIPLIESGLVGEGGGLEVDGDGTVLAAKSSWVNPNRNPKLTETQIADDLTRMLGAKRVIWIDGLAGADITDGHIDTLARFINPETILVDVPHVTEPDDPWIAVAESTKQALTAARTLDGQPYTIEPIAQPATTRESGDSFLSTYMNFYVCNGGVIAPQFGDTEADSAAQRSLERLFPGRKVVMVDIDPLAAGGGGIHCATQQQPKPA